MPAKKKRSRKKTGATRNTEQSSSKLSVIVIVVLLAAFAGFLMYLDKIPTEGKPQQVSQPGKKTPASDDKKNTPPKHQFDFYTVLPDREVEVTEVNTAPARPAAVKAPSQKKTKPPVESKPSVESKAALSNMLYQLQVGAFSELAKADAMKANLALLGVVSNIQVIQSNGKKMYRVRVGPSTDIRKIEQIKKQLKAQNINTFMQKLSG